MTRLTPFLFQDAAFVPNYVAAAAVLEMYDSPSHVLNLVHPRPARMLRRVFRR